MLLMLIEPIVAGLMGVGLFALSVFDSLPQDLTIAVYPACLTTYALIHAHASGIGIVVAAAFVQFIVYVFVGIIVSIMRMSLQLLGL